MKSTLFLILLASALLAQPKRARDLGVPFDGSPGTWNAITDVAGVEVGHTTLIEGDSVRTGVTVIWPRGKQSDDPVFGGWYAQNGNGEMTGTTWLEESGFLAGAVLITNTHSVGVVRDAFIAWQIDHKRGPGSSASGDFWSLPVVAETWDGYLNDINGFHVKPEHVFQAMDGAASGKVAEGNVGGGTGMVCFGFKGGIGTSSRVAGSYKVAALVQCNCGVKKQLRIAGAPVGQELAGQATASAVYPKEDTGSIIIVVATDAPLLPTQLKRLARRATLGLGRMGAISGNGSGDIFIAFSTANGNAAKPAGPGAASISMVSNDALNPIFEATVQATEEAIVNAMVAAKDMTGVNGHKITALPHDGLQQVLKKYNRLAN
jgi:L-aminopeptidase/D-esterase-like protein